MTRRPHTLTLHHDQDFFVECLKFTSGGKGFRATLIEKDYFCSVLLAYMFSEDTELVFKGGTCLQKVYTTFYRLSEDIDLSLPVSPQLSRKQRSRLAEPLKCVIRKIPDSMPAFTVLSELQGYNNSTQYIAKLAYRSCLTGQPETIKVEIGLREPLLDLTTSQTASTLLVNPFTGKPAIPPIPVVCLSKQEAYAEKIRAALTRRDPAIRDFFDVFHASRTRNIDYTNEKFLEIARKKLELTSDPLQALPPINVQKLYNQLETELQPVLRREDFTTFNLHEAVRLVQEIGQTLQGM